MEVLLELVPNRVFFQIRSDSPSSGINMNELDGFIYHFHCMDNIYKSVKIRKYFGPMTLTIIHRHCALIDTNLKFTSGRHLFYTNNLQTVAHQQKRTNAIFLMGCYLILRQNFSPEESKDVLHEVLEDVTPYTDMEGSTAHALYLLDCWRALFKGMIVHRWFRRRDCELDIDMSDGSNDVINWVVPGYLLALEDPREPRYMGPGPRVRYSVLEALKDRNVNAVVRLNSRDYEYRTSYGEPYDSEEFVCRAMKHYDIFFKDGGIPSEPQLNTFLKIVKKAKHPVAVHCHAGRGRTGTMLACSLVRFWGFEAVHAIAWVRMCRAAAVVGIQQGFVKMVESSLLRDACSGTPDLYQNYGLPSISKSLRQLHFVPPSRGKNRAMKSTRSNSCTKKSNAKETKSERPGEKHVRKITVLPISGYNNGQQDKKLETTVQTKIFKNKERTRQKPTPLDKTERKLVKSKQRKAGKIQADLNQVTLAANAQVRLSGILDLHLSRKMHLFQDSEFRSTFARAEKSPCLIKKSGRSSYLEQPRNYTVDPTRCCSRLEAILHFRNKPTIRNQFEIKENTVDPGESQSFNGKAKGTESLIPFTKAPSKYSGYQSTFDHLTKILSFEKTSKSSGKNCRMPTYPLEEVVNEDVTDKLRNKKDLEIAWKELEVNPNCTTTERKRHEKDAGVFKHFQEKCKQTWLVSITAGGSKEKRKIRPNTVR